MRCSVFFLFVTLGCGSGDSGTADGAADAATEGPATETGSCANADLQTDSTNCGRCGHDCLGGACQAGVCQPVVIAAKQHDMSSSLVVDSENAYWVNLVYGVMRVPITGGTPSVVPGAENGARAVGRVALDSTYVYWTSEMSPGGEVRRAPKAGGAATTIFTVTQRPKYIAVHGGAVTWSTWDNLSGAYTITTGAITGGMQKVLAFGGGVMGLDNISGLVADDMYAYWSDTIKIGHVASVYLSGGVPPAVWGLNARGTSIAIDSTNMYWLETDSGAVKSCPKTGCVGQPTTLASGTFTNAVPELATDGAFVYWTDGAKDGTVTRVRVIGGTPEVLATGQKQPTTIAVDDKAVYWVSALQEVAWGSVMRLAKP